MRICIIGAGVSGLLLILLLHNANPAAEITIIDPHFDGGDLCRLWGSVPSNTRWEQAIEALKPHAPIPAWAAALPPDLPTTLAQLARLVRDAARPALEAHEMVQDQVTEATYTGSWSIRLQSGESLTADTVIFTHGGQPKMMPIGIPSIPLEAALDRSRLQAYLRPQDSVLLFGTNHSGVLALKHCLDLSANVTAVHKGAQPFKFAPEDYDGLKLDTAAYARRLMEAPPANLTITKCDDMSCVLRATRRAAWVIYATGFQTRAGIRVIVNEQTVQPTAYDGTTGVLRDLPQAWGFGLAYPSQAPDGVHWDVGVAPFLEHMSRQVPRILRLI